MNRFRIALALPLISLLLIVPAAFADDDNQAQRTTSTTESATPAPPPVEANAVPREVAPNVGGYGLTYGPFKYDPAGNIIAIGNDYYIYDPIGRLTSAAINRPDQPGTQTQTYGYDTYGNRITVDGAAQTTSDVNNRLTAYGAVYDTAGNLKQWTPPGSAVTRNYTYDALGMITKENTGSQSMVYIYTADDERLWSLEGLSNGQNRSHWTVRDLTGQVLRDLFDDGTDSSPDWQLFREYVYRGGGLLAINTSAGTQHVTLDHLGTPRLITDGNRYKLYHHFYLPFGEEWTTGSDPSDPTTLRFTGHERDFDLMGVTAGTKDYMHARYFAPKLARFFSTDPVFSEFTMQNPQGWNRYAYVVNSPLNYIDPRGMDFKCTPVPGGEKCTKTDDPWVWDPLPGSNPLPGAYPGTMPPDIGRDVRTPDPGDRQPGDKDDTEEEEASTCTQEYLSCLAACIQAGDPGQIANVTALLFAPVPKSVPNTLFGTRITKFAGGTRFTTWPSILSQHLNMPAVNTLRTFGHFASTGAVAYGVFLFGVEVYCASHCAANKCAYMD